MTVFLSGGCKNGKSTLAEQIAVHLSRPEHLYYLATMIPHDEEDRLRIARHVQSRAGLGFQTVECGLGLAKALEKADPAGSYLLDSVTALLSNEMFRPDGSVDLSAPERVAGELTTLCRRLNTSFSSATTSIPTPCAPANSRRSTGGGLPTSTAAWPPRATPWRR